MSQQEGLGCIVVWFHHEWKTPAYQVYLGLLFALPLAVTSFNRFSRLLEALTRRYCQVLTSLYFDDARITDVRSAKGSGQWAMNQLCVMIGSTFAEKRSKQCRARAHCWALSMTSVASTRQAMFAFGHVTGSMTQFVKYLSQHFKQATSVEARHPSSMALHLWTCWVWRSFGH